MKKNSSPTSSALPSSFKDINTVNSPASKASRSSNASKILIITYYWPPCGGAGVQRWLKFAKYLPYSGWEPIILTVDPNFASYPATDDELEQEIGDDLKVHKTPAVNYFSMSGSVSKSVQIPSAGFAKGEAGSFLFKFKRFIRGNFFIPDPRRGWNRYAYNKAIDLINNEKIDYVVTTSPPHSSQLIGAKLKRRFPGIKWVADFRDPWTDIYYYGMFYHTLPARLLDSFYEKRVLTQADLIIVVGETLASMIIDKGELSDERVKVVTNGYDEDDFKDIPQQNDDDQFIISYVGTISNQYPVNGLIKALDKLIDSGDLPSVRLRFVGQVSTNISESILSKPWASKVEIISYANHYVAINYMANSNLLILVIPDHQENRLIVTGKLFEYLRTGNPVLCIGPPDGDAAKIIEESGAGKTFGYDDIDGVEAFLKETLNKKSEYKSPARYSRNTITKELSRYLDSLK